MKSFLQNNDIGIYSTHSERKSVAAERFIRTLKIKIYKYVASILKNVYIDKLDDIVNKYDNTYHSTIKMKPVDVKSSTYIDSSKNIDSWICNGMSEKNIKHITKSDSNFAPTNNIYIPKRLINVYMSYVIIPWLRNLDKYLH